MKNNCSNLFFVNFYHFLFKQFQRTNQPSHFGFCHITLACFIVVSSMVILSNTADARVFVVQSRSGNSLKPKCKLQQSEELHVLMDRICLVCHEMFSHERPNMRAECRSNCFRSEHFRKCLAVFTPPRQAAKMLLEL
uniref:Uncharacterized protein n=1 Tax=Panagrolaimus sp. JU765 TaxID=591449 RepID=A0AC34QBW2_9BILA